MERKTLFKEVYLPLLNNYGKQGWFPVIDLVGKGETTSSGKLDSYHPGDHTYPKTDKHRVEICLGSILVQMNSWKNTEKALLRLNKEKLLEINALNTISEEKLAEVVKASRYYKLKANYVNHPPTA